MENNILKHRMAVMQNIQKSFNSDLGVESFDDIEKGKWNIGDTKVYQGVTYEVGGFNAKGTPLWRKAKGGASGGATNSSGASSSKNNTTTPSSQNNTASTSSSANKNSFSSTNDISKIPDKEYRKITNILEKYTPDKRYLDPEEMSDQELMNFKSVAESFVFSRKISKSTRDNCRKWSDLASDEVKRRKSSQNNVTTNSSTKTSNTSQSAKQSSSAKSTNSKNFDYYLKKYGDGRDSQEAIANWRTWWIGLELKGGAKTIGNAKYDLLMDFLYKNNDKEYVLALTNALLDSFSDEQKKGKMLKKKYEHIKWLRDNTDVRVDERLKRMSKK